ncbi:MAG: hypothetical protein JNJ90_17100 [Saprospiraceae bacterium]|jgi:hypothetical protein|nr:hypothetical protein [Saprospiraceae bacterium]
MKTQHFIPDEEQKRFEKQYFPRMVVPADRAAEPWRLERIYNIIKKGSLTQRFECYCIQVEEDDGASWAAEKVNQNLLAELKDPKGLRFQINTLVASRPGGFPVISDIIGRDRFVHLARKSKLTKRFHIFSAYTQPLMVLLPMLIAGFAVTFLNTGTATGVGLFLTAVGIGFIIKKQVTASVLAVASRSCNELVEYLDKAASTPKTDANYRAFILELVRAMGKKTLPRFVIIDKWAKIDRTSQIVIEQYFSSYYLGDEMTKPSPVPEFWIVFEDMLGDQLSQWRWETHNWEETAFRNIQSFKIQLLTSEEKHKLGEKLNLPPQQLKHKVIKRICHDDQLAVSFEKKIRTYRREHSKSKNAEMDAVDFLYLLSLTHNPVNISFTQAEVETIFVKDRLRASILKFCLQTQHLPSDSKPFNLSQVPYWEDTVVDASVETSAKAWKLRPEVCEAVGRLEHELDLPDRRYGHLFWAAYWKDRLAGHPYQSAWFRKLSYHLKESESPKLQRYEPIGLQDDSRDNILQRVYEDYLFTIEGCLRTCVFDHIQILLEDVFEILLELKGKDSGYLNKLNRLLIRTWEVYAILLDDSLLYTVQSINKEIYEIGGQSPKQSTESDVLETFFYDTLPLPMQERVNAKDYLYCLPPQRAEMHENILDYMRVRSAWLVLLSERVFRVLPMLKLPQATAFAVDYLEGTFPKLHGRLEKNAAQGGRLNLMDLMTVSNAVWCFGLHMRDSWLLSKTMRERIGNDQNQLGRFLYNKENIIERSDYFLSNIEKTLQLVLDLRSSRFDKPVYLENEFFFNVILSEITSNALGALTLAYHNMPYLFSEPDSKTVERANNLVDLVAQVFDYQKLPNITSVNEFGMDDWVGSVDEFMELTGLIWKRLGLEQLYQFMNIRRVQLNTVCYSASLRQRFEALTKTANLIQGHPTVDFFANLAKANFRADSREMQSLFVQTATKVAIDNRFSEDIVRDFCVAVSLHFHDTEHNIDDLIALALTAPKKGMSSIAAALAAIDESDLTSFYLNLHHVSKQLKRDDLVGDIQTMLASTAENIRDVAVKYEIQLLNRYFDLQKTTRSEDKKLDSDKILMDWEGFENGIWYPAVLSLCLMKGTFTDKLKNACNAVFKSEIHDNGANTYIMLAFQYTRKLMDLGDDEIIQYPMRYLEQAERFTNINSADINKEIFVLLSRSEFTTSAKRAGFSQRAQYWTETIIERDSLRFQGFLRTSNYFHIFNDIFEKMAGYGLPVKGNRNDGNLPSLVDSIPPPILLAGTERSISADFLKLGMRLFQEDALHDSTLDQQRMETNNLAKDYLNPLLDLIDQVPGLPGYVKTITGNYRKSILTKPDIEE